MIFTEEEQFLNVVRDKFKINHFVSSQHVQNIRAGLREYIDMLGTSSVFTFISGLQEYLRVLEMTKCYAKIVM
ncbi:hypothetical protein ECANGB1_677 [Enterospora canceri]|uniref:Uncharacterized protein n=1 Tax=Enterospora canceri TaxID=1081671 RepID=A0A1Y1S7M6_9MICR|nr:hypothetical protein ECANGB1_677 [Enterospora canceri]